MLLRAPWLLGQSDSSSLELGIISFLVQPFEYEGRYALPL